LTHCQVTIETKHAQTAKKEDGDSPKAYKCQINLKIENQKLFNFLCPVPCTDTLFKCSNNGTEDIVSQP